MKRIALGLLAASLLAVPAAAGDEKSWAYAVSLYGYDVPADDYVNANVIADHGHLHLEARYQYESVSSGSIWAGANFTAGESWTFDATMMLGVVFGDIDGVAPGYRLSLSHKWFSLASEGEYFVSTRDNGDDFLYSWNEVAGSPVDWFRIGIAGQRTRAYQTDLSLQRGPFVGFTYKSFDVAAYAFNIGTDDLTYVLSLRWDF